MKEIPEYSGVNPDQLRAVNESLRELERKVEVIIGSQGTQKMLGDLDMNGFRITNVRNQGWQDAITMEELKGFTDSSEFLDLLVWWNLALEVG